MHRIINHASRLQIEAALNYSPEAQLVLDRVTDDSRGSFGPFLGGMTMRLGDKSYFTTLEGMSRQLDKFRMNGRHGLMYYLEYNPNIKMLDMQKIAVEIASEPRVHE